MHKRLFVLIMMSCCAAGVARAKDFPNVNLSTNDSGTTYTSDYSAHDGHATQWQNIATYSLNLTGEKRIYVDIDATVIMARKEDTLDEACKYKVSKKLMFDPGASPSPGTWSFSDDFGASDYGCGAAGMYFRFYPSATTSTTLKLEAKCEFDFVTLVDCTIRYRRFEIPFMELIRPFDWDVMIVPKFKKEGDARSLIETGQSELKKLKKTESK